MADDNDRTALVNALLGPIDPRRSALRLAVENQRVDPNYTEVRSAPDRGPIQSPLGLGEPLASRLPSGALDILAGILGGPRAPVRVANPIRAYHGSPHDFSEFSTDKIGTGERAQSFGHGLYFAQEEPIARYYRDALAPHRKFLDPVTLDDPSLSPFKGYPPEGVAMAKELLAKHDNNPVLANREAEKLFLNGDDTARFAGNLLAAYSPHFKDVTKGKMYEVNLHADPGQLVDLNKPLSQQSRAAQRVISKNVPPTEVVPAFPPTGEWMFRYPYGEGTKRFPSRSAAMAALENEPVGPSRLAGQKDPEGLAAKFREAGIPGAIYDAGSLSQWKGQPSRNYVVWSPEIIEILRKYGLAGAAPVGGATLAQILSQPSPTESQ